MEYSESTKLPVANREPAMPKRFKEVYEANFLDDDLGRNENESSALELEEDPSCIAGSQLRHYETFEPGGNFAESAHEQKDEKSTSSAGSLIKPYLSAHEQDEKSSISISNHVEYSAHELNEAAGMCTTSITQFTVLSALELDEDSSPYPVFDSTASCEDTLDSSDDLSCDKKMIKPSKSFTNLLNSTSSSVSHSISSVWWRRIL